MGIATVEQVRAMDYGFNGSPFVRFPLNITVDVKKMDYAFEGVPFVCNYEATAVTTICALPTEIITVVDVLNAFNTFCHLTENAIIADAFSNVLLVAEMAENIAVSDAYTKYYATCALAEDVIIVDTLSSFNLVVCFPIENITVVDGLTGETIFPVTISDGVDLADVQILSWLKILIDELVTTDLADAGIVTYQSIADGLLIYDEIKLGWKVIAESSLILTDAITTMLGIIVDEWINFIDVQSNNWNGREIISENVTLYDIAKFVKIYADSLSDTINIADVSTYGLTITVLEYLGFTELANAMKSSAAAISDSINVVDNPALEFPLSVESILSIVDLSTLAVQFLHSVQSDLSLADVSSLIKRISDTVTDPIVFVDTITSHAHLYSLIYDTLALNVIVELDGEVWECYVLNTPKFHPSMYSGFNFNSYCVFENRAFGANDTGIYELTGDTDAGSPIHTGVILSETNFGSPNQKRFRRGYLDISGTSPKMILETGEGQRQAYAIDEQGKMVASHELKSKSWKLSVADFETLSSIKLIPIILTK